MWYTLPIGSDKGGMTMRMIFVRHGEPDYARDCLTDAGRRQAEAVAERLAREGISEVYASPMGRAAETASYTAGRLGLPVRTLDFMREVVWGGPEVPDDGHPWTLSSRMYDEDNFDFARQDWRQHPFFRDNPVTKACDHVAARIDEFTAAQGYRHEGRRYLCTAGEEKTVAVFSHGGSGACALAHLLSLPFPLVCTVLPYGLTSVIILEFPVRFGEYVHPRIELFNDMAHVRE